MNRPPAKGRHRDKSKPTTTTPQKGKEEWRALLRRRVSREEECWCVVGHDDDARILKAVFGFEAYFLHYTIVGGTYHDTREKEKKRRDAFQRHFVLLLFLLSLIYKKTRRNT